MLFAATVPLGLLAGLTDPIVRAIMARHLRTDEQGALQGALSALNTFAGVRCTLHSRRPRPQPPLPLPAVADVPVGFPPPRPRSAPTVGSMGSVGFALRPALARPLCVHSALRAPCPRLGQMVSPLLYAYVFRESVTDRPAERAGPARAGGESGQGERAGNQGVEGPEGTVSPSTGRHLSQRESWWETAAASGARG